MKGKPQRRPVQKRMEYSKNREINLKKQRKLMKPKEKKKTKINEDRNKDKQNKK